MDYKRLLTFCGLLLGIAALSLQFSLSIPSYMAAGSSFGGAVVLFFSYFTILTNSALVLVYLSAVTQTPVLGPFRGPVARGLMAATIALVMIYYHVVLSPTRVREGIWELANLLLHYIAPPLYLIWWMVVQPHGRLRFAQLPAMVIPPLFYLPYVLLIGAAIGHYPYPILNVPELGYWQVIANSAWVVVFLILLCVLVVAADKVLVKR